MCPRDLSSFRRGGSKTSGEWDGDGDRGTGSNVSNDADVSDGGDVGDCADVRPPQVWVAW